MSTNITFKHGLGDAAQFSRACHLWTKRGHKIRVDTHHGHDALFRAVGCEIVSGGCKPHPYYHPGTPRTPVTEFDHNKLGHNLTCSPMPIIGTREELWSEYLLFKPELPIDPKSKREVDDFLSTIDEPLVIWHSKGNTCPSLTAEQDIGCVGQILKRTDATVLLLDEKNLVPRFQSRRVRHLLDDFRSLAIPELCYLISRADLLFGIDSGVLHLATTWTQTPCCGIWQHHHPTLYATPSPICTHLCPSRPIYAPWTREFRHRWNTLEYDEREMGQSVGWVAEKVIEGGLVGKELCVEQLLERVRDDRGTEIRDRDATFGRAMCRLSGKPARILETGCIRREDDWSAGMSTYLLGLWLLGTGGHLDSVDHSQESTEFARRRCSGLPVSIHREDSVYWLGQYRGEPFDLVYLDSKDTDLPDHAEHCLREAKAAVRHVRPGGQILIDDSPWVRGAWSGKGKLAIPWLLDNGWIVEYSGWGCLMGR